MTTQTHENSSQTTDVECALEVHAGRASQEYDVGDDELMAGSPLDPELSGKGAYDFLRVGPRVCISFHRTLRVPDDGREYPLPASLGCFPIHQIDDYAEKVPSKWRDGGGYFIPMYQAEAMFLQFEGNSWSPAIAKVAVGGINAITGERFFDTLSPQRQDYVVVPDQKWLDGINSGEGFVNQFVAAPIGMGYTIEGQITDEEDVGGIQIIVIESREDRFILGQRTTELIVRAPNNERYEMGLASGGRIRQKIRKDEYGIESWDINRIGKLTIRIVNSEVYRKITGQNPPPSPITAEQYAAAGIPWFDYPEMAVPGLAKASKFQRIITMERVLARRGQPAVSSSHSGLFDKLFTKLIRMKSNRETQKLRELANLKFAQRQLKESMDLFTRVIREADDVCADDFVFRSICRCCLGQYAESQKDASSALQSEPENPRGILWHGWSSLRLGQKGVALSDATYLLSRNQLVKSAQRLEAEALGKPAPPIESNL